MWLLHDCLSPLLSLPPLPRAELPFMSGGQCGWWYRCSGGTVPGLAACSCHPGSTHSLTTAPSAGQGSGGPWGGPDPACSCQSDLRGALAWPSLLQSLWVQGARLQTVWAWLLPCGPKASRSRKPRHGQGLPPAREEPGPGRGMGCQQQDPLGAHPLCPILWAEGSASSSWGARSLALLCWGPSLGRDQPQTCS